MPGFHEVDVLALGSTQLDATMEPTTSATAPSATCVFGYSPPIIILRDSPDVGASADPPVRQDRGGYGCLRVIAWESFPAPCLREPGKAAIQVLKIATLSFTGSMGAGQWLLCKAGDATDFKGEKT